MNIREDLKAFLDNELTPERALEVSAAIDQDPALREEYLFMKQLSGDIKSAVNEPQVKGLDKATERVTKPRFNWALPRWATYGVAGLAAVFVIGLVGQSMPNPLKGLSMGEAEVSSTEAKMAAPMDERAGDRTGMSVGEPRGERAADSNLQIMKSKGEVSRSQPNMGFEAPTAGKSVDGEGQTRGGGGAGAYTQDMREEAKMSQEAESQSYNRLRADKYQTNSNAGGAPGVRDRKVIRTAQMGLKVKDVGKAMSDTETQVAAMGGFVENTNFNQAEDASKGTMNFQVPEKNFDAIVEYLGKAGTIISNRKTGTDVTGEIAYTDGRVISLADEELNLIKELQRTKNSTDRLEIRSRLSNVRQEMRGLKEQNKATKDLAEMSRFVVSFEKSGQFDSASPDDWFGQTTNGAGNVLGFFGRIFGVGLIYTVFLAPVWLPIVGIVWYLRKKAKANIGA